MRKHLIKISGLLGVVFLTLCFQNCGDMVVQDGVIYQSSLAEYSQALDQKVLPAILSSGQIAYWSKPNAVNFVTLGNNFFTDQWSIVLAVNKSATGTLFTFNSGASVEEGRISVESGKIRASRFNDASNYSYVEANLPDVGREMVIGATFGADPSKITLLVNGIIQNTTTVRMGTPGEFSYLSKSIGPVAGSVIESFVYGAPDRGQALDSGQLNVMSRYIASENTIANVIYDPALMTAGGDMRGPAVDLLFAPVKNILSASCISCHTPGSSGGDLTNFTAAKAVANGWVVAGNPAASKLYARLQGSLSGSLTKNMPQSGSALSAVDVKAVSDWILGLH